MQKQSASETSRPWTITTSRTVLIMVVALWLTVSANFTFWRTVWDGVGGWNHRNPLFPPPRAAARGVSWRLR